MLDLLTDAELIARIAEMLDQHRELLRYAGGEAEEAECPELHDQIKILIRDVDRIAVATEVLAARPEFQSSSHRQLARPGEPLPAHQLKEQTQ